METASIAIAGEVYPKFTKSACSNAQMLGLIETRGYSAIASCVIEHIVTNHELKESERLYYVLADLYANYERAKNGPRSVTIPGAVWEERLNLNEEYVFVLQKALEAKGYFQIIRNKIDNQNEINVITPTTPTAVFESLKGAANRHNPQTNADIDEPRAFLDDTKMFVRFNNKQVEALIQDETLSPLQKLIWILLYMRSTCSYQSCGDWHSTITQAELCNLFKCSQSTASKALTNLEKHGFISKQQNKLNDETTGSNRRKKSVWFIEALFPQHSMHALLQQKVRANLTIDGENFAQLNQAVDNSQFIPTVEGEYSQGSGEYSQGSGHYSQSSVSSIKDITTKSFFIKNNKQQTSASLDVIDVIFETSIKTQESKRKQDLLERLRPVFASVESPSMASTSLSVGTTVCNCRSRPASAPKSLCSIVAPTVTLRCSPETGLAATAGSSARSGSRPRFPSSSTEALSVDIMAEKNRRNIAKLSPELVQKAVNFAKKLKRDKLCAPSLLDIDELELARQFIHHAANYKMTKLDCKTRGEEIDAALSFAWRAAKTGQWRCPVGWGMAIDLHLECEKYRYEHPEAPVVTKFQGKVARYLDS